MLNFEDLKAVSVVGFGFLAFVYSASKTQTFDKRILPATAVLYVPFHLCKTCVILVLLLFFLASNFTMDCRLNKIIDDLWLDFLHRLDIYYCLGLPKCMCEHLCACFCGKLLVGKIIQFDCNARATVKKIKLPVTIPHARSMPALPPAPFSIIILQLLLFTASLDLCYRWLGLHCTHSRRS